MTIIMLQDLFIHRSRVRSVFGGLRLDLIVLLVSHFETTKAIWKPF